MINPMISWHDSNDETCFSDLHYGSFSSQPMIQLEKPVLTGTMPVVWPTILDLGRDECKRILRKLGEIKENS